MSAQESCAMVRLKPLEVAFVANKTECEACGAEIATNAKVCPKCGHERREGRSTASTFAALFGFLTLGGLTAIAVNWDNGAIGYLLLSLVLTLAFGAGFYSSFKEYLRYV